MTRTLLNRSARCAVLLAVALPLGAALAGPAEDYIVARNKATAAIAAAVKANRPAPQVDKADRTARRDLEKRMVALLGPLRFKGLDPKPAFSPDTLVPGDLGTDSPDGLVFTDKDATTHLLVSPEPVFADWLKARAADEGAPAVFKAGIAAAARDDFFFTLTVSRDAAFTTYAPLPLAPAPGEDTYAALGLFAQDGTGDALPDSVVVLRVADGRVAVAATEVKLKVPPMPACTALWKDGTAKADALLAAAHKDSLPDDPRVGQSFKLQEDAATAY
ncbi:hypothetical protein K9U40_17115, partial [Xanthobacter autotrophicus]|uniref:hypothetical protein n=2 Tax=Xanthobacter TaxID=279 RepID=UPI0024AB0DB9